MKLLEKMKIFYDKHFKSHCPKCGGIINIAFLDMEFDKFVYECRDCKGLFI